MNKKMQLYNRLHKLNTAQIITLGFAGVIILGGLLLWLPFCTAPGYHTSFTDAMFTATTSICVTGLVTVVTATHWTLAGKIIILVRRCGTDFPGQYYFYKSEKENIAEEPACYPGVL